MNRTEFVKAYVAAFLGAWAANETDATFPGWQKRIIERPPIEDAVFQAEQTWERCRELEPKFFEYDQPAADTAAMIGE